jgi:hypothetical protein
LVQFGTSPFHRHDLYARSHRQASFQFENESADRGGAFTEWGAEEGVVGLIIGVLLDILISVALGLLISVLLWVGVNVVVGMALIVFLPGFYLFRRAVRMVLARGRACRGDVFKSGLSALTATVLYTGWFHAILWLARYLVEKFRG